MGTTVTRTPRRNGPAVNIRANAAARARSISTVETTPEPVEEPTASASESVEVQSVVSAVPVGVGEGGVVYKPVFRRAGDALVKEKRGSAVVRVERLTKSGRRPRGAAGRKATNIQVTWETHSALEDLRAAERELCEDEALVPAIYQYVEVALANFMPSPDDAKKDGYKLLDSSEFPSLATLTVLLAPPAASRMRDARKLPNLNTGVVVPKTWYYEEAINRFIVARRALLGLAPAF